MNPLRYYSMLPEDDGSKCMYCDRTDELVGLYSPSRDSPIYQNEVNLRVTACKRCRTKIYPLRREYRSHQQKYDFLKGNVAIGPKNDRSIINGDLLPCRIAQNEADEGYNIKPGTIKGRCAYCSEPCGGNRDFIPTREMAKYLPDEVKYIVPACLKCINRTRAKSIVTHTFEGRLRIIESIEGRRQERMGSKGLLPWQARVIDGENSHVFDRPENELPASVIDLKRIYDAQLMDAIQKAQPKEEITVAVVHEGDVDDIISYWEHG